jgi:cytochrome c-type biogenesis protein
MERLTASLRPLRRTGRILQMAAGTIMIVMGIAIMTGRLSDFSFWLLDQFPALGSIG